MNTNMKNVWMVFKNLCVIVLKVALALEGSICIFVNLFLSRVLCSGNQLNFKFVHAYNSVQKEICLSFDHFGF